MSYARRMTRPDATQSAIVAALRQCGVQVWIIGQPTDLLTFYRGKWLPLECKPELYKRPRADQKAQTAFLKATGTPVVKTVQEAYTAVVWPHTVYGYRPRYLNPMASAQAQGPSTAFCDVDVPCGQAGE